MKSFILKYHSTLLPLLGLFIILSLWFGSAWITVPPMIVFFVIAFLRDFWSISNRDINNNVH